MQDRAKMYVTHKEFLLFVQCRVAILDAFIFRETLDSKYKMTLFVTVSMAT